jgi:hypothetical protein
MFFAVVVLVDKEVKNDKHNKLPNSLSHSLLTDACFITVSTGLENATQVLFHKLD